MNLLPPLPLNPRGNGQRTLFIQIPCLNEAGTLPVTLRSLPRAVAGYDAVRWLVIDDGSTDGTHEVALREGADFVLRLGHNRGLAEAFTAGLDVALKLGADTIVNTDGDNQYDAACVPDLVAPILERRAAIVVGARPVAEIAHFSRTKKLLQRIGSRIVSIASGLDIPDAPSGFRAMHWTAAIRLRTHNRYSYVLEHLIQAGRSGIAVASVPIRVNPKLRPSRLIRSLPDYLWRSGTTIIRIFAINRPLRFFGWLGVALMMPGVLAALRFLIKYFQGLGGGHVQSLILGAVLIIAGVVALAVGLLADLIAANRKILEQMEQRQRLEELMRDPSTEDLAFQGVLLVRERALEPAAAAAGGRHLT
ncbi:MAG TPA: glycosyltransferase family 2 protein [Vicinamibacterales bacterium]|nr:glycosyltransferase family 2 protein [Vicinamibacterales bacterium]